MFEALPPPAQRTQDGWDLYLNTYPAVSRDLNQFRVSNYYPNQITRTQVLARLPIPVPHTENKSYSSIETAKRKQKQSDWFIMRRRQIDNEQRYHKMGLPLFSESVFRDNRPNIRHFFSNRMPRSLM